MTAEQTEGEKIARRWWRWTLGSVECEELAEQINTVLAVERQRAEGLKEALKFMLLATDSWKATPAFHDARIDARCSIAAYDATSQAGEAKGE